MRQIVTAGLDDAPVDHNVHDVGNDVRKNSWIVRDDQEAGIVPLLARAQSGDGIADVLERIDALCEQFEMAWESGPPPALPEYLAVPASGRTAGIGAGVPRAAHHCFTRDTWKTACKRL